MTLIVRAADRDGPAVEGTAFGTGVTVLIVEADGPGHGPKRHVHTYDEVFVVHEGRARYTVGDQTVEAGPGDVVFGPANVPHTFVTISDGPFRATDVHLSPEWVQTDLED